MLRDPFIVVSLTAIFTLVSLYCLALAIRAHSGTARTNYLLTAVMSLTVLGVALGWNVGAAVVPLVVVLSAAFLWFTAQAVLHAQLWARETGFSAGGCIYRALTLAVAIWILASAQQTAGSAQVHPAHQLGSILGALIGAVVLTLACAAWLLATFATPKQDTTAKPIPPLKGFNEAFIAAGLAIMLFAMA